ncbi:hypothetical protein AD47_2185 [Escherichia coli 6-319-05_S4_C3]|nr:hypothetical protein AD47_5341 [Escherichia coli 6-319-05_S4_C3]KEM55547.1 hypothetical protein AD47_4823 [Escherichia coli 6-319-05_S4_C3]KEM56499.1 hypothetical protein AD47_4167 [Escherichia coli 6-319-05_S4_C3]KEM56827.1 hypothetical protein AD47_4108 [Escherichia coli 6-319-05_S4_C3]KEM60701.1 hypothetical protein AD47_3259 [Escherichia coli 6-319-05_S4_C3]
MKKRFSDEQIISILREAEAGDPPVNSAASMPFPMPRFTPGVRSMAVWRCLKLSA